MTTEQMSALAQRLTMVADVLRAQAENEVERAPATGFEPATRAQVVRVVQGMHQALGDDHDRRLAALTQIFPYGVTRVASTNDLSKAEASVLIRWLFGLARDEPVPTAPTITEEARQVLSDLVLYQALLKRAALVAAGQKELFDGQAYDDRPHSSQAAPAAGAPGDDRARPGGAV